METQARYVLIGAFTLAGLAGALAMLLWLAQVSLDRQVAPYEIVFPSVSGLAVASDVRFSGLLVGRVVEVRLAPEGDGSILVRVEIDAHAPVRADSVATVELQGVTGVSFVAITAGTPAAPLLAPGPDGAPPRIPAGRSVLQSLADEAPDLLAEARVIAHEASALLSDENRGRVERILDNVEGASEDLGQSLQDLSRVAASVSEFATQMDAFNGTLAELTDAMTGTLGSADAALGSITALADDTRAALSRGTATLDGIDGAVAEARRYVAEDLAPATREVEATAAELRGRIAALGDQASALLAAGTEAAEAASARLEEAQATLAAADAAFEAADRVIDDDVAALAARLRTTLDGVDEAVAGVGEDVPAVMSDLRAASASARDAFAALDRIATASGPSVEAFAATALPSYARLAEEARGLVATLNAIASRIERDPARFLLSPSVPEFRR